MQNYKIQPEHQKTLFKIFKNAGFITGKISLTGFDLDGETLVLFINDPTEEEAVEVEIPATLLYDVIDESGYNGYTRDHYNQYGIDYTIDETTDAKTYYEENAGDMERAYFCNTVMKQVLKGSMELERRAA